MKISVEDIKVSLGEKEILKGINSCVNYGEFVGLIGPNGSGKSTLLKSIYRVLKPNSGMIKLNEQSLFDISLKDTAKKMAVVRQFNEFNFDFRVEEIVLMGRAPHKNKFELDTSKDYEIVNDSLKKVEMEGYSKRKFSTLSGGEKQRIMLARALAQQAKVLILDEPTNHLDIKYQIQLLDIIKSLGITVFSALHDLNLASAYCDRIYVMKEGEILASGKPDEIINKEVIRNAFGIDVEIIKHPITEHPYVVYNAGNKNW